jgi:hypothetical protein
MTNGDYIDFHKQIEALVQQWIDHAVDFHLRVDVVDQIRLEEKIREMFLQLKEENAKFREALMSIAVAEDRESYPEELWAAFLMDKARSALVGKK